MLNPVLMLLARDRYVSDGCEEAMAQGLAESYARRFGYCYPYAAWHPGKGLAVSGGIPLPSRDVCGGWVADDGEVFIATKQNVYRMNDSQTEWMDCTGTVSRQYGI
jgi:hypothetical protein